MPASLPAVPDRGPSSPSPVPVRLAALVVAAVLGVLAPLALAPGASAQAAAPAVAPSDANLRAAVTLQEARFAKDVRTFRARSKKLKTERDLKRLRSATSALVKDAAAYRRAMSRQRGETTPVETGRIQLLGALTKLRGGFSAFRSSLDEIIRANTRKAVDRAAKKLDRAGGRIDKAVPLVSRAIAQIRGTTPAA